MSWATAPRVLWQQWVAVVLRKTVEKPVQCGGMTVVASRQA